MAGVSIDLKVEGLEQALKDFNEMQMRAENKSICMQAIAAMMHKDIIGHFMNTQGARDDGSVYSWLPPKERNGQALQDTGLLRNSIHYRYDGSKAIVYTNVKYAAIHNYGGPAGSKKGRFYMPRRRFMWMSTKALELSKLMLLRFVKLGKAGHGV